MSGRKQKSPDPRRTGKKQPARKSGLFLRLLSGVASLVARHPKPLLGSAGFVVLFSFVAANALWYQPGGHPAPFLATRDSNDPNRIAGYRPAKRAAPGDVTTFRIERAPDPQSAPPVTAPQAAPPTVVSQPASAPATPGPTTAPFPAQTASPQPQPPLPQPMPMPHLQQVAAPLPKPPLPDSTRREPAKKTQASNTAATTGSGSSARPTENVRLHGDDPIAAAIRSSERNPIMTPPADIPTGSSRPARQVASASGGASQLVSQIQKGLSNIAYTDVEMDGVAGAQTKAAIRRFEKHYRLPETGEPNEAVLKKLKAIGAL
ncbi:peptidoglycan-binding protein [Neorhizobium lilium]|uniref:Peptidoglycan-binding protein n=1 Tax=Neorhizobium lilium TaxID=2503024 RepID=A0A3S4UKW5_9HYPH|nr:peptidoglycan-binding domain-containing protein [Neorhizobium lilium]RWX76044.1 peptidoglycan-binding protein [Neorhizobium lilium]